MGKVKNPKKFLIQKLNEFTNEFLSELEKSPNRRARKAVAHKVLLVFLGNYSCFAEGEAHAKCKELMNHFCSSINDIQRNERLDLAIQELVSHMSYAMNTVEDKESIIWTIIRRLICLYVVFAESDQTGTIICHNLGKEYSKKWRKSTPMKVTLSILEKRDKDSKLSFSECEALEKYSFWVLNLQN